ncbi:protein ASPARTIC PROTEASE IN GUARD CELL 1-like [Hibiscus syriacus]|uniref:Protein ASPARTIC PROTEASE IN GUARD CELL 1-like n=1 Tax=Hibiscus syriacus TaxID=106335 RepID=A0A6A3CVJ2_HIBSY|nr:uncharacterized protein LOC120135415 [Hibiscus syriacus]KAE8732547.1 protein ASPARTIC PROTEASE IN GUARD CELL 1-like [Hibiscus syriacus]
MKGCAICYRPMIVGKSIDVKGMSFVSTNRLEFGAGFLRLGKTATVLAVRASAVDSYESSSYFVKRMGKAWAISQQPRPIVCSSCDSKGHVECQWCRGTCFFILGDNMLCQVPSRNSSCVICAGKGSKCYSGCKVTGFRAKWMGEPPISK